MRIADSNEKGEECKNSGLTIINRITVRVNIFSTYLKQMLSVEIDDFVVQPFSGFKPLHIASRDGNTRSSAFTEGLVIRGVNENMLI